MNNDDVVWSLLGQFCSFMTMAKTSKFCRNEYNLTGLCNRRSCPLANSQYATVREEEGVLYLYVKHAERAHLPAKLWLRVKLSLNYEKAVEQIKTNLIYWRKWTINKCLTRYNRLLEVQKRKRKLVLTRSKRLVPKARRKDRHEVRREDKALVAARLETVIEKELLDKLRAANPQEFVNLNEKAFEKALDEVSLDGENEDEEEEEDESEEEGEQFVEDFDESDEEEVEDIAQYDESEEEEEDEANLVQVSVPSSKRPRVTVEYDDD